MKKTYVLFVLLVLVLSLSPATAGPGKGIVGSIVNAPVVPDGNVAGLFTEVVINLDVSMDPNVAGRGLMKGKSVRVTFPDAFDVDPTIPTQTPFTPCAAAACNVAIFLQGWPQHPLGFPPPTIPTKLSVSAVGPRTIQLEALIDFVPSPPLEPGIKLMHLILPGFTNPHPGHYEIEVEAETGPGGALETGSGRVHIVPKARPFISVTSIIPGVNPGNQNTIYQQTTVGQPTPLPYRFLMWQKDGVPALDVEIQDGRLVQGNRTVGQVSIEAPAGASGQEVISLGASIQVNAPVSGRLAGQLDAEFTAGSTPGLYTVKMHMAGGNTQRMFVHVSQP